MGGNRWLSPAREWMRLVAVLACARARLRTCTTMTPPTRHPHARSRAMDVEEETVAGLQPVRREGKCAPAVQSRLGSCFDRSTSSRPPPSAAQIEIRRRKAVKALFTKAKVERFLRTVERTTFGSRRAHESTTPVAFSRAPLLASTHVTLACAELALCSHPTLLMSNHCTLRPLTLSPHILAPQAHGRYPVRIMFRHASTSVAGRRALHARALSGQFCMQHSSCMSNDDAVHMHCKSTI